ncbi:MAG: TonB-dependent receptor plug domain-containing protein [Salibacteraceae bacterium]
MLNNRIGLTGLLLLGSIAGFAQTSVVVKEAKSNVTLPGAHVVFYAPNSKDSVALQTDVSGKAELPSNWASGDKKWSYRASFVGYQTQHDTLKSGDKSVIYLLPSLENLGEVVVTAQYEPGSSEDAVHVVRVIDREKIDHMAAVSLDDVLSNALNIRLSQDNVLGSRMSMQGISGRNVKILVDGIPMIGRQDGNLDLSQINLQDIERIEVVEGPLSVNFGTDALAGTINLITRKGGREKIGIRSTTYQETIGTYNQNLSVNFNHKNLFARVSGTRNFFDGWNPGDDHMFSPPERSADETRVQQWKPREQWLGSALVGWRGTTSEVSYQFRYFEETIKNRGFPRPPYGESAFDDQYITRRTDHGINYKTTITDNIRFSAVAGYNHYEREKNTFLTDLTTLGQSLSAAEGSQDTSVFELWMSRGSAVFGADSSKI